MIIGPHTPNWGIVGVYIMLDHFQFSTSIIYTPSVKKQQHLTHTIPCNVNTSVNITVQDQRCVNVHTEVGIRIASPLSHRLSTPTKVSGDASSFSPFYFSLSFRVLTLFLLFLHCPIPPLFTTSFPRTPILGSVCPPPSKSVNNGRPPRR